MGYVGGFSSLPNYDDPTGSFAIAPTNGMSAPFGGASGISAGYGTPSPADGFSMSATDTGMSAAPFVGAGVQAASTTANLISQAVQAQSQREFGAQQGSLDRALQAQLTAQHIGESKYESNLNAQGNAYQMLLQALSQNINNTLGGVQNIRNAAQGFDSLLSKAFLR